MNASTLTMTSSLLLAALGVLAVMVAAGAGLLACLVLLRYADTTWAGWLLGVGTTNACDEYEQGSEIPAAVATTTAPSQPTDGSGSAQTEATANSPEPLDHLAADFAVHAQAVRAQVSRYADLLADGDAVLRARLRRLEDGGSISSLGNHLGGTSGGAR